MLTALVACVFGWVAKERSQSKFERQLGKELQAQGCKVTFLGPYDSVDLNSQGKPQGWRRDSGTSGFWEKGLP